MEWHEIESWHDYLAFFRERGYQFVNETVLDLAPPSAVSKTCEDGHNNYRRLQTDAEPEVLQLRARRAEEKDCGHPARRQLRAIQDGEGD